MIMKRSIYRNLRYFLTLVLFAILGALFILSLKGNDQNGSKLSFQSVTETENRSKFSRLPVTADKSAPKEQKAILYPFGSKIFNIEKRVTERKGTQKHEKTSPPLDIYIFEEHHEALPYWFGAAYNGTIPKTGNTLIHIDGHSDMAPPIYFPGYPFFRWPTKDEIKYLLQRNDAFIQSAIMSGLVTRLIWVWPEWDRKNHEKDYVMSTVKLGWTVVNSTESKLPEVMFCMCQKTEVKIQCMYPKDRDEEGVDEVLIEPETCHTKKVVLVEEINELKAISFLKDKDWIHESENVILDIDEDFFGCSYVIKPLLDTNASINSIRLIDENLRRTVCPRTTLQEKKTNQLILEVVSLLILQKTCQIWPQHSEECKGSSMETEPATYLINLLNNANDINETKVCIYSGKHRRFENFATRFIAGLLKLTIEQLEIVHDIGFCSTTTPKTLDIYGLPEFGLCYGANTPLESAVTEFNPTILDIKKRSVILRSILRNTKQYSPKIVTLCRSMRDGYTPRKFFKTIENGILTSLENTFTNINLHYDSDLLDGKAGRQSSTEIQK